MKIVPTLSRISKMLQWSRLQRPSALVTVIALTILTYGVFVVLAANQTWDGGASGSGTAWYTAANWVGDAAFPGSQATTTNTDIASIGSTGTNPNLGINGSTSATLFLGAIDFSSASRAIGDSAAGSFTFTLNGATVNSVSNVILRNSSTGTLTLQPFSGGAGTMSIALGNATDNIINIDSTGGVTISSVISGSSKKVTLGGVGTGALTLSGVNTYSGDTKISSGRLALSGSGSIANSPTIEVAGGATFDVTGLTTSLTLASGQALKASGTTSTGTITTSATKGLTTAANSPLQFTAFNGTIAPLTISGAGTVTLQSGNVVTVTVSNGGTPLGAGDYTLISKGATGSVAGTAPTSLTVNGDGIAAGNTASLQITGSQLILHVAGPQTYTWAGPTLGITSWILPTSWTPTRVTPAASDILVFDGSTVPAPTASDVPTETIGRLRLINGAQVTMTTSATNTLTIGGGIGTDFEMIDLSQLTLSGSNGLTISLSTGAIGSVDGVMIVQGGAHRLIPADASGVTFISGAIFTTSTGFTGNAFGSNNVPQAPPIVFASGSSYFHNAGGDPFGAGVFLAVAFQPGSTETYSTTSGFSTEGRFYGNLVLTGNQTYSHSGTGPLTVQNDLTIQSGSTLNHTNTGATGISIAGALMINGTLSQASNLSAGSVAIAFGAAWSDTGSGNVTLGGNLTNDGTLSFNGGGVPCGEADTISIRSSLAGIQRTWSGTGTFLLTDVDLQDQNGAIPLTALSSTNSGNNTNWTFGACGPSFAKIVSFNAARYDNGRVGLEWQTGFEVDNLGFNVYREQDGKRVRVTPQLVAGSALLAGPGVNLKSGRSYSWLDDQPGAKGSTYWLEDVSLQGKSTWHGPITAEAASSSDKLAATGQTRSMLLARLGTDGAESSATTPMTRAAKPAEITTARLSAQSGLASQPALKLSIKREGWYRVTQRELVEAGLDPQIDPRMLQLVADGREQPMMISGEADGRLDASDAIEFYGLGVDAAYTDTRAYWLVAAAQPGLRVELVKGKGSRGAPASFPYTVERKDRTIYFSGLKNGEKENFFGAIVAAGTVDQKMTLRSLDRSSSSAATVEVALQGVTFRPHRVLIAINEVELGEMSFLAQAEGTAKFSVAPTVLREGENAVKLSSLGGESDLSLIDYIRITYPHAYAADDNALRFTLAKKQNVTIGGFTSEAVRVLDITDPDDVREVASRVAGSGSDYSVTVSAPKGGRRTLMAFTDEQARRPESLGINQPSNLRDASREADLVIITRREFFESVRQLQTLRQSQGLSVAIVDIEDIYDEFSYGVKSPQAVKDFLLMAGRSWHKSPRFALFVGDASLDPKNYLGSGDLDLVPTKLVDTTYLETASDDWLADFDDDGMADIALGRLPVRTAEDASRVIAKIVSADGATRARGVVLVADGNDSTDFETLTDQLRRLVPRGMPVDEIYRGRMDTAAARAQLLASLSRGPMIVNYSGHGNVDLWRGGLLTGVDADALTNGDSLSLFLSFTCLNGYFQDVALESLAESLLKAERGGAAAVWASTGLCEVGPQAGLNQAMFSVLFEADGIGGPLTLGEATLRAKRAVNDIDVRRTYILFGDPSTRLR